jgi:hypothetical protein
MPQSGWDEPTEQAGPTPWHAGVVEPVDPGQPRPPDGSPNGLSPNGPPTGGPPAAAQPADDQPPTGQPYGTGRPYGTGEAYRTGQPYGAGEVYSTGQPYPPAGQAFSPDGQPLPPAGWRPLQLPPRPRVWRPSRGEVRAAIVVVVLLAAVGAAMAVAWWQLAPRLGFRIVSPGNAESIAAEQEQFFATDGWFTLLTLAVGVLAALLAWRIKALRGPVGMLAVAVGGVAGALVSWRLGLLLAPAPTQAQLQEVGRIVYPALRLRATAALMVEPLAAVGTYLLLVGFAPRPDLGHPDGDPPLSLPPPY